MENKEKMTQMPDDLLAKVAGGQDSKPIQRYDVGDPVKVRFDWSSGVHYEYARVVSCVFDEAQNTWIYNVEWGRYQGPGWTNWKPDGSQIFQYPQEQLIRV